MFMKHIKKRLESKEISQWEIVYIAAFCAVFVLFLIGTYLNPKSGKFFLVEIPLFIIFVMSVIYFGIKLLPQEKDKKKIVDKSHKKD